MTHEETIKINKAVMTEKKRCIKLIESKSAIFHLFNGNNTDLKVKGVDEFNQLIQAINNNMTQEETKTFIGGLLN